MRLASLLARKKYAEAVEHAEGTHKRAMERWALHCREVDATRQIQKETHAQAEAVRLSTLATERSRYAKECEDRDAAAAAQNNRLMELIANLGYGAADAVHEYVSVVLSNSVYPDHFEVSHEFEFDPLSAELRLRVLIPGADAIPSIKGFKYSKAADEISSSDLSQKQCRDRYAVRSTKWLSDRSMRSLSQTGAD